VPKRLGFRKPFENFNDRPNLKFATKSKTRSNDHTNTFHKRLPPTTSYQSRIAPKNAKLIDPISEVQQNYRPQYQQYYQQNTAKDYDYKPSFYSSFSASSSSDYSSSSPDYSPSSRLIPEAQNIQNAVRNSTFDGIPGWIRRDFPGYNTVPYTGFRCELQAYSGYYADVNAGCQV